MKVVLHFGRTVKELFFIFSPILKFKVLEESMIPLFYPGDFVLVEKINYLVGNPKIGDLVVLRSPKDGKLLIKKIQKVHDREFFVVGENQKKSIDSRSFGLVDKKDIIGRVFYVSRTKN
ncbi:nickel-type superoxide dismutase maturation protease [Candidatus Daviesbacteria bacterium]|nr:nickel-type superoxide dismutase maturation protease [Candidatus Daviesbacteria bacterium]